MGSRRGFLGESVLPFAIMVALVRRIRPALFVHECTRTFGWRIFTKLFPGYTARHLLTDPTDYGFPVKRGRSYTAVLRDTLELRRPVNDIYRLYITPGMDAGCFFAAPDSQALDLLMSRFHAVPMQFVLSQRSMAL